MSIRHDNSVNNHRTVALACISHADVTNVSLKACGTGRRNRSTEPPKENERGMRVRERGRAEKRGLYSLRTGPKLLIPGSAVRVHHCVPLPASRSAPRGWRHCSPSRVSHAFGGRPLAGNPTSGGRGCVGPPRVVNTGPGLLHLFRCHPTGASDTVKPCQTHACHALKSPLAFLGIPL